jgi:hypothetical protein
LNTTLTAAVALVGLLFLAVNFVFWLIFRWKSNLLLSKNERLGVNYLARFEGELKPYISESSDIAAQDWRQFARKYRQLETRSYICDDFVQFKHPAISRPFRSTHPADLIDRHYGLGDHERPGADYRISAQKHNIELDADIRFVWLADIQENDRRPLYVDNMQYTSAFSCLIAEYISDALIERRLIDAAASR